jgi:Peptidase family C25
VDSRIDKAIITNRAALRAKYGDAGVVRIRRAVSALIAADERRGLRSRLICLDDVAVMARLGAVPVARAASPRENKIAIDGIYGALAPDYLMILGAVDVVPHQDLRNLLFHPSHEHNRDPDPFAFADLPYACEAPYNRKPQNFLGPTRVVGRLPDLTGGTDPAYLIGLLKTAASYKAVSARKYQSCFAITAQVWQKLSALSLIHTFGTDADLRCIPPHSGRWRSTSIGRRAHFINCHGNMNDFQFYGQSADGSLEYPIALDSRYVDGRIVKGTVAAVECCYGGQLYDSRLANGQRGICNAYLSNKAYGFFASTTIAYGPDDVSGPNDYADIICQYFLQNVLRGFSLGRAALEARQKYVRKYVRKDSPLDPHDLKTLSQFNLYGDPSVTPVMLSSPKLDAIALQPATMATPSLAARTERRERRRVLFRVGLDLARTEPQPHPTTRKPAKSVRDALEMNARKIGINPSRIMSFVIRFPTVSAKSMPTALRGSRPVPSRLYVVFGRPAAKRRPASVPVVSIVALIGREVGGKLVSLAKVVSR